jgi:predicted GNAT family acetyltransferase
MTQPLPDAGRRHHATVMADIEHDPRSQRFTTSFEGHHAELAYEIADGRMVITHTNVPNEISGRGIASRLARAAFEHARDSGLRVQPMCSYAAGWAERHPEYRALLD